MRRFALAAAAAALLGAPASALEIPLDLGDFVQVGPSGNGNWVVAPDGLSVTQTINGEPTAFVGPDAFIDQSFEGTFRTTDTDNDYMGFVFGFGADETDPFLLFTWKQGDQSGSSEGFTLSRVTGGFNAIPFGDHQTDAAGYDVVATNLGSTLGYVRNSTYQFKLTYQQTRATIEIGGAAPFATPTTIFDVTPGDFGLAAFAAGRFGFYNHSQDNVTYAGFTREEAPDPNVPPTPNAAVPLPAAASLMFAGLGALGVARARRRG